MLKKLIPLLPEEVEKLDKIKAKSGATPTWTILKALSEYFKNHPELWNS